MENINVETVEKECDALGGLFQAIVNDMKCSYPVWEDFSAKATKLHAQLRTTVLAAVAFLDAFQKVADMATNTRVFKYHCGYGYVFESQVTVFGIISHHQTTDMF
ncbi:hypothetical protein QTP70_026785 [Hemibagrus guttatus]|uniref:IMD domain-containing protein n=1 Tax=Hemibagrus guttatus TaxID=175788 RepID=A0AAE0PXU9_9TELE|nr:hypothetical protein QTP70_026785 [Hemibagrus guttatus]